MTKKQIFWTTVAGQLAALVLLDLAFGLAPDDGYRILVIAFCNLVLIAASGLAALVVSILPMWRPYAGAWWLGFGLLLLASIPVCFLTTGIAGAISSGAA